MGERDYPKEIYSKPDTAPWTYSETPPEIIELIEKKTLQAPAKILEVGCGEGHQAVFLAKRGFEITAIDSSKKAIDFAKTNASAAGVKVNFICEDYCRINELNTKFDFIFDWRFFHEITNEKEREEYANIICEHLESGGKYLYVAFSWDSDFMGEGFFRKSPIGAMLYFEPLSDAQKRLSRRFKIIESKHITVPQKPDMIIKTNYLLCQKQ